MVAHVGVLFHSSCFPWPRLRGLSLTKQNPHYPFAINLRFQDTDLNCKGTSSWVAALSDDPIREWILTEGKATQITRISPVGGGCINLASRYHTDLGSFFVKTNRSIGPSMFEGEALGLSAMYEAKSIRVPQPFKVGPLPLGGSYIIMEFIEFGSSRGGQSALGRKLAEMHKAGKSDKGFGFDVNNTIGSTPQINTWSSDWIEFFAEHRLGYQLKLALDQYGDSTIYEKGQRLMKNMGPLFENVVIEPCLLHGDLWSGNISSDKNGEPVILDPACYYVPSSSSHNSSWSGIWMMATYSQGIQDEQSGDENFVGMVELLLLAFMTCDEVVGHNINQVNYWLKLNSGLNLSSCYIFLSIARFLGLGSLLPWLPLSPTVCILKVPYAIAAKVQGDWCWEKKERTLENGYDKLMKPKWESDNGGKYWGRDGKWERGIPKRREGERVGDKGHPKSRDCAPKTIISNCSLEMLNCEYYVHMDIMRQNLECLGVLDLEDPSTIPILSSSSRNPFGRPQMQRHQWRPADQGMVAINLDGSLRDLIGGCGIITRNDLGTPLFAMAVWSPPSSVLQHELEAISLASPWEVNECADHLSKLCNSVERILFPPLDFPSALSRMLVVALVSLEHATLMAKQLPSNTDPCQILEICSSLQNAHHQLGTFLAQFQSSEPQAGENSVSSILREDEPMQIEESEAEENSKIVIDKVEQRMRNCVLQNKRRKRPLSPSSVAAMEQRPSFDNELFRGFPVFDPNGTRLRSLDLVFQFHG
ncbi:hypothetical protein HHK36_028850 [Tetracentron sinense]|uniref:protein-ribulosamine 3-kinase n=1 Tax=Tetracentron sinense TaxID=13715 RepID=A0A834YFS8_TETSI|nr:hypothetical protein HHK36_028850 [Tetracentron sinense]